MRIMAQTAMVMALDKCIGCHIHSHVLHTHQRTLASVRHTEGSLHGCLLVGAPAATHLGGVSLYELCYLC